MRPLWRRTKVGGLCAALEFVLEKGIYGISIYPYRLAKRFFESAKSMDDVNVYGDFGNSRRVPTVSISVKGFSPQELKRRLSRDYGMVVEAGLCGGTKMHQAWYGRRGSGTVQLRLFQHPRRSLSGRAGFDGADGKH